MIIVAMCPYCRLGGVRAPQHLIGVSATCPKCGSNFTVMPDSGKHGWSNPRVESPAATETRPHTVGSDVTEPSPVLEPRRVPGRGVPVAPVSPPDEMTLPLVAVALFGPAVLATQLPFGRAIALALVVVAAVLALLGLASDGRARRVAQLGLTGHFVFAVLLLAAPYTLGLDRWSDADDPRNAPHSIDHATGDIGPADLIDASAASWEAGDVRVSVLSATLAPLELTGPKGAKRVTKEHALRVVVRVANEGVERRVELGGWALGQGDGRLTDHGGAELRPKKCDPGWEFSGRGRQPSSVFPGHSVEVSLAFDAPRPSGLTLELSGDAVGSPAPIRFALPDSFVNARRNPK
ncbi:MAG TPA: hypothetical protein VMZ71_11980 [Gemmataceae bacterium]|nr:hypothetical protein [Gemmataceae bacterium]